VISKATGVSWIDCQRILTVDLNMRCDAAKFVPRLLTKQKKKHSFDFVPGLEETN
jgi:hypothetical protein